LAILLARYAKGLSIAGFVTCGLTAIIAIPVALWSVVESRRRGVQPLGAGAWVGLVAMAVCSLWFISGLFYARNVGLERDAQSDCLNNIKQINLAAILYAEDHGGHAPPPAHWIEALQAYSKMRVFQCPAAKAGMVGYAYNPGVSDLKWDKMPEASKLVTFFDGTPGRDVVGRIDALVPRHGLLHPPMVAAVAFADGRVTSATMAKAESLLWRVNRPTHLLSSHATSTRH
jgi:hypothetical protein